MIFFYFHAFLECDCYGQFARLLQCGKWSGIETSHNRLHTQNYFSQERHETQLVARDRHIQTLETELQDRDEQIRSKDHSIQQLRNEFAFKEEVRASLAA